MTGADRNRVSVGPGESNGPSLRAATPGDEPFFRALYGETRRAEFAALCLDEASLTALCNAQFAAQATGYRNAFPQADHFVVCRGDRPVGRMVTAREVHAMVLLDIALVPAVRGRGWGRLLVRRLQEEARALGVPLRLHVERTSRALAWYLSLGFAVRGEEGLHSELEWPGSQGSL